MDIDADDKLVGGHVHSYSCEECEQIAELVDKIGQLAEYVGEVCSEDVDAEILEDRTIYNWNTYIGRNSKRPKRVMDLNISMYFYL